MKVYITRVLPEEVIVPLAKFADIEYWGGDGAPPRSVMLDKVRDIDGLLCLLTEKVDAELVAHSTKLKVVSQMAVGVDNIDVTACSAKGIVVGNTPGVLTETTADLAFALLMATARDLMQAEDDLRTGKWGSWSPFEWAGTDIHHATVGIIGMGRIGYEMARRCHGFQMEILYTGNRPNEAAEQDFGARRVALDELLSQSDFVSLHTPLKPETRHLIGAKELAMMKPTGILINTARGPVVDQAALVKALRNNQIAAAGLDVFEIEPLPLDDPLFTLPNVTLLPHIGSATMATRLKMAHIAVENLILGIQGKPLKHQVN